MEPPKSRYRFLADVMLGSLTRWLRILGYDTAYDSRISDDRLVARCRQENRIALTRDRRLVQRKALQHYLLINSHRIGEQLRQVLEFTGDDPTQLEVFRRCLECNVPLLPIAREEAAERVPPYVLRTQTSFSRCPACDRIYWAGTHRSRMLARLSELLKG